jgi:hypothetical protein
MTKPRSVFWNCNACGAQNHEDDGECQYCECGGVTCGRDSCSDPRHFCPDTIEHAACDSARRCVLRSLLGLVRPARAVPRTHAIGCVCEACSVAYERERWTG